MNRNVLILIVFFVVAAFVGGIVISRHKEHRRSAAIKSNVKITDKKRFNEVLRELKEEAQKDPHNALRWIDIAKLYNNAGDYEKAYLYLKKSLKMQPDFKYRESVQEIIDDYEEAKGIKK